MYLRTKDGKIYKTLGDYMQSDLPPTKMRVENVVKGWHIIIPKSKIVKQSNTIKELCDEFVYKVKGGGRFIDDELANEFDAFESVHGAIWNDKGLIYVAKMNNNKGDLELL